MAQTQRNAPCPCGSGRKYKACCGARQTARRSMIVKLGPWIVLALVAIMIVFAVANLRRVEPPEPYEYDAISDRHWDPDHGHWHDGPPPGGPPPIGLEAGGAGQAGAGADAAQQPEPWEYDAANDRHWNPDEGEWLLGPPVTE